MPLGGPSVQNLRKPFDVKSGRPVVSWKADTPPLSLAMGGAIHNVCSFKTYNATDSELFSMIGLPHVKGYSFNVTVSTFEGIADGGPVVHRPQYAEHPNIQARGGNERTLSEYTITALGTSRIPLKPNMTPSNTTFHPNPAGDTVASPPTPVLDGLNSAVNQHFVVTTVYQTASKIPEVTLQIVLNKATADAFNAIAKKCPTPLALWEALLDVAPGHPLHGLEETQLLCKMLTPKG